MEIAEEIELPEEIIFQILARLPPTSLIKLKTVCKFWFNIISDPKFVDFNLQQWTCTSKLSMVFGQNFFSFNINIKEMIMKENKLPWFHNIQQWFHNIQQDQFTKDFIFYPHSSCDGLILLQAIPYDFCIYRTKLLIFNSFNGKLKVLPSMPDYWTAKPFISSYSLVHDVSIQKYKVVKLCIGEYTDSEKNQFKRCCIFTLDDETQSNNGSNEAWRILSSSPLSQSFVVNFSSVSLNGFLYWIAETKREQKYEVFIQALDIEREEFKERIELPCQPIRFPYGRMIQNCTFLAMKGSLCFMIPGSDTEFNIWVLKEDCSFVNGRQWMKYRITLSSMLCKPVSLTSFVKSNFKPLFVMESCRSCLIYIFVWHDCELFCYNMESRELRQIAIEGHHSFHLFYPFIIGPC